MWSGWAEDLGRELEAATGLDLHDDLDTMLGYDRVRRRAVAHGRLAATPMVRLRELTRALLVDRGLDDATTDAALDRAWHAPDPVVLARPVTDLVAFLGRVRASGLRVAVATTDDRAPTLRTFEALGITELVDEIVCADDGIAPKPSPDMVRHLVARFGVPPERTIVVGDSVADLAMGRAAGVARCYGVLTGVGTREDLAPLADAVLASVADLVGP